MISARGDAPVRPCIEASPAPVLQSLELAVGEMRSSSAAATDAKLLHSGNQPFGMDWSPLHHITKGNLLAGVGKPWEGFLVGIGAGIRELNVLDTSTRPFSDPPTRPNGLLSSAKDLRPELHEALRPHTGRRSGRLSVRLSAVPMADRMLANLEGGGLSRDGDERALTDTSPLRRPKVCWMPAMRSSACSPCSYEYVCTLGR
jgi:hypothetical protein